MIRRNIISILYKNVEGQKPVVADSLKISVNAGVDSKTLCTVEPNKDYKLSSKFELGVPLELGDKFEFEYRTVIDDLSETAAKMFEYGSVGLSGKITNGFPLSLNLQVRPLDSNGNAIPLKEEVGILNISSCDAKGNPVTSDINFVLSGKGADLSDMKAIEIVFKADAKAAAGVPFNKDSFIQLSLNALLPDGVTLDVKELGLLEGQENQN